MLREQITQALKEAMRARDTATVGALRLIMAGIKNKDIDARPGGTTEGIGDQEILSLLQYMIKQRRDSIVQYHNGGRPELAEAEAAEIAVIERFMPKPLDAAETDAAIAGAIADARATSIKDMGTVMAVLKNKYSGRLDFSAVGPAVKAKLGG